METFWFIVVALMLAMYAILDGFDLGAGIVYLLVAKSDEDRRMIHAAIGPVWDGNEVWILAAGGTMYLAFPLLYASSFSGFYLPLMIVLWLLILRGLGIEMRHHVDHPMWKTFWDGSFALGSSLLAIFLGAALGNVVRGVPLGADGYFFEPLWTSFTVQPEAGILDWFTVLMGIVGFSTLTVHGGNYLAMKTGGELRIRSARAATVAWWVVLTSSIAALIAVSSIRPGIWDNYAAHFWGYLFPLGGVAGLAGMMYFRWRGRDTAAFLSSSVFIGAMLGSTAFGLFPVVLPASTDAAYDLTIYNTAAGSYGLGVGVVWLSAGIALVAIYFGYLFYRFRGRVGPDSGYGQHD